jgi:Flp pilus assembly pilin Flp
MLQTITTFYEDESGAVSVDWTVLTAGIVGLAVAAYILAENGTLAVAADVVAGLISHKPS